MSNPREERLAELARRVLAGEDIDWTAAMREDPSIVAELRRLQVVVAAAGQETGTAVAEPLPSPDLPPPPPPPRRSREDRHIGDFRLVRTLGEGGMGIVYEAEQQHPRRPVALKVIRGGAHVGQDTLKLFQREAQTLARLRHAGIAQLYETGVTDDGLHYFAMELVRGETLGEWLKKRSDGPITPAELKIRLGLFRKICDAVAYAHQKGVIHRDLKPGNILIPTRGQGSSIPDLIPDIKVLDFGLARMTESDVQMTTYVTEMGKVQGTLPYMSPEQVRGNPDEIDQRTDVYSMGVLLYEMMTGRLPYDLSKAQLPEAVRIICEQPPRSMVTTFTGTRRLDADLITIAGKALEKEPARRYQSAAALGEDVGRWLNDQPILARPPSTAYQFRKLVRRHKGPFAFAGAVFVLLAGFAVVMTIQAAHIASERDRANQEAETAKQVSEFLEELFKVADPSEARGETITAKEILDRGAEKIAHELEDQPIAQARLQIVMAKTYLGLGLFDPAESLLKAGMEIYRREIGERSVEYGTALSDLAWIRGTRGQSTEAIDTARSALDILKANLPDKDPRLLKAMYVAGATLLFSGKAANGGLLLEELLRRLEATPDADPTLMAWCLNDLGIIAIGQEKYGEARTYAERSLAIREREFAPDSTERLQGLAAMAYMLTLDGDLPRARSILEQLLPRAERVYGSDSINLANILDSFGEVCRREGRLAEAESYFRRSIETFIRAGVGDTTTAVTPFLGLGRVQEARGDLAAAEATYRTVIETLSRAWGQDAPGLIDPTEDLARLLRAAGRLAEAQSLEKRIGELRARSGGQRFLPASPSSPTSRLD